MAFQPRFRANDGGRAPLQLIVPILIIALFYLGLVVGLPLFFEFPLNDDTAYTKAVKYFVENCNIRLSDWIAVSFVFQLFYGAAFSIPFGFSFSALRAGTLLLSFIGTTSLFLLLRELKFSAGISLLGAFILAANPVYLNLSYTFMTDVPFLSMILLSSLFYVKAVTRDGDRHLMLGSLFAVLAGLIRQPGIVLPLAMLLYYVLAGQRITLRRFSILMIIPGIVYGSYLYWLIFVHGVPQAAGGYLAKMTPLEPIRVVRDFALVTFTGFEFIGLFLVPLTLPLVPQIVRSARGKSDRVIYALWTFGIALGVTVVYAMTQSRLIMPYAGNIINDFGLGPFTLRDTVILQMEKPVVLPRYVWWGVTVLSSLSAVVVGGTWVRRLLSGPLIRQKLWATVGRGAGLSAVPVCVPRTGRPAQADKGDNAPRAPTLFIYIAGLAFWLSIVLTGKRFDRYFLVLLLPAMLPLLEQFRKSDYLVAVAAVFVLTFGIFGIAGTQDYVRWNAARWSGIEYLMREKGAAPAEIDGGYEFNYWYNYERASEKGMQWWWALDDKYVVAFRPLADYTTIKKIKYPRYLSNADGYIYVLERRD